MEASSTMAGEQSESKNYLQPLPPDASAAAKIEYPPGYRFMPTDAELIMEYLLKKIKNLPIPIAQIRETYLRLVNPMDLTETFPKIGDNEWYFFTPRDRKYPNGKRPDRGSESGYWKATGADKEVLFQGEVVGFRKALVFYQGKPQKGQKTNWIMHEFRVKGSEHKKTTSKDMRLDDWVLCRLYQKSSRVTNKQNGNDNSNGDEETKQLMLSSDSYQGLDLSNIDWYDAEDLRVPTFDPSIYSHQEYRMVNPVENMVAALGNTSAYLNEEGDPNAWSFEPFLP